MSWGVVGTLWSERAPSAPSHRTMSVNVPSTSMPMRNRAWLMNPPQTGGTIRGLAASRKPQDTSLLSLGPGSR